ncbi:hypothetical protein KP509_25G003700 [Ceratopteris richardii]|uniref:Actin-related protein 9 n=1 Tax=Ceratopteris richardii TaxID=49495 RepID=A0A8T2RMH9_CERRI|nr:hypothetical protein KP509_25G003700 [Ceratopteris richardii]
MDYYKLMVPSQLIAERGSDVVVINPGSRNLRLGLASSQSPIVVPHFIAWRMKSVAAEEDNEERIVKGAIREEKFVKGSTNGARKGTMMHHCILVEMEIGVQPPSKEEGRNWQKKLDALETSNAYIKGKQFGWTDVNIEEDGTKSARKFICGAEALKVPASKPYCLHRPILRGRFNASEQYSFQQVCDDLSTIWDWALTQKLGLDAKQREQLSAVLVVPETFDGREIKELLTITLRDLQFSCAVVHQESVAVTFGTGASSGCVVNIGAQVTSVICVEEGVALPSTRVILPYGGEDISRCLLWLQRKLKAWPHVECDPLSNPVDLLLLEEVKEKYCCIEDGDHRACVELEFHSYGCPSQIYKVVLSELNVPPLGLFLPVLLASDEYAPLPRPWYHTDSEEIILDEGTHVDAGRRPDMYETGLSFGSHVPMSDSFEHSFYGIARPSRIKTEERSIGLAEAVVNSILASGRIDIQKKLFSSIQLAGGGAMVTGIIDAVEERVLQAIPVHESIDTVEADC